MRRYVILLALSALLLGAAPAAAQVRDPFEPLATDGRVGGEVVAEPIDEGSDGVPTNPRSETDAFPNTGGAPAPWLLVAYMLIAFGAGALVLERVWRPLPVHR